MDQGGRMKSQVKGSNEVMDSIWQKSSAAFIPLLVTFLPSKSPGTEREKKGIFLNFFYSQKNILTKMILWNK